MVNLLMGLVFGPLPSHSEVCAGGFGGLSADGFVACGLVEQHAQMLAPGQVSEFAGVTVSRGLVISTEGKKNRVAAPPPQNSSQFPQTLFMT